MKVLVVTNPFGGHEKGHRIADPAEIEKISGGEHAYHVVRADHEIELAGEAENPDDTREA